MIGHEPVSAWDAALLRVAAERFRLRPQDDLVPELALSETESASDLPVDWETALRLTDSCFSKAGSGRRDMGDGLDIEDGLSWPD